MPGGFDPALDGHILDGLPNAWTGFFRLGRKVDMKRSLFKSKIHRATVTDADLEYEGSVTVDEHLMRAADMVPFEHVHIWNVTNGSRLETYVLPGPPDSGTICVNGAAARHAHPGDRVIIATFAEVEDAEARGWKPTVVRVDERNRIVDGPAEEVPGPQRLSVGGPGPSPLTRLKPV